MYLNNYIKLLYKYTEYSSTKIHLENSQLIVTISINGKTQQQKCLFSILFK